MTNKLNNSLNIAVIGGGVIGLSAGWQLLRHGHSVSIYESGKAGASTSRAGAGMIAPNAEAVFEEEELLVHNRKSLELFKPLLKELAEDSGIDVPTINNRGSLMVALDQDDRRVLQRLYKFRKSIGLSAEWLSGTEAREREPLLSPKIIAGLWLEEDCEINNILLLEALKKAFLNRGGKLLEFNPVNEVKINENKVEAVNAKDGLQQFDRVIIAAGSYSGEIKGIGKDLLPPLRPVKGQIIELNSSDECTLSHMIRSPRIYLVPKDDGRLLLGATSEEKGFDTSVTAGGLWYLLDEGWQTVPGIYELSKSDDMAGLRPSTPDHRPVIGPCSSIEGLCFATGFFRHGFLLMPLAAYGLAEFISNREQSVIPDCFLPARFDTKNVETN